MLDSSELHPPETSPFNPRYFGHWKVPLLKKSSCGYGSVKPWEYDLERLVSPSLSPSLVVSYSNMLQQYRLPPGVGNRWDFVSANWWETRQLVLLVVNVVFQWLYGRGSQGDSCNIWVICQEIDLMAPGKSSISSASELRISIIWWLSSQFERRVSISNWLTRTTSLCGSSWCVLFELSWCVVMVGSWLLLYFYCFIIVLTTWQW